MCENRRVYLPAGFYVVRSAANFIHSGFFAAYVVKLNNCRKVQSLII